MKTDKYNTPREILKGLKNCILKKGFFLVKKRFFEYFMSLIINYRTVEKKTRDQFNIQTTILEIVLEFVFT